MASSSSTGNGNTTGTESTNPRRRRRHEGDIVNLRFNPTNDDLLSVFVGGSIFPCMIPPIFPGPFPTPTPSPVPDATAFMNCLLVNGFEIRYIEVLTPTDIFVTLVRN
ncbi:hypothetical protein ACWM35_03635 [Neobacillus sp. K501]